MTICCVRFEGVEQSLRLAINKAQQGAGKPFSWSSACFVVERTKERLLQMQLMFGNRIESPKTVDRRCLLFYVLVYGVTSS